MLLFVTWCKMTMNRQSLLQTSLNSAAPMKALALSASSHFVKLCEKKRGQIYLSVYDDLMPFVLML